MRFKVWFERLPLLQKGELYGIVIAFFIISYLLLEKDLKSAEPKVENKINQETPHIPQTKKSLPYIETLLENNHLFLHSIYNHNGDMTLEFEGDFLSVITFLRQLQTITKILEFELHRENELLKSKLVIENKKYLPLVGGFSIKNICNPFIIQEEKESLKTLQIEAIIDKKVMIEGQWYGKNDLIENYQIETIEKDFIVLLDKHSNKNLQIRVFDEP